VTAANEHPERPVPAVGAIVFRGNDVLLVKRGNEPNKGRWSVPGGALEIGETVEEAVVRETLEETRVLVRPIRVVDVLTYVDREPSGPVRWHYVLIDVLCEHVRGEPYPSSDAENARFIPLRELGDYDITPTTMAVLEKASGLRPP